MSRSRLAALAVTSALVIAACGGPGGSGGPGATGDGSAPGSIRVVATTTVLADLVRTVGGSHVTVDSLVPKGGEVHTFDPRPTDAVRLTQAALIVANGLGLDDWLARLARDAGATAPIVALGENLDGVTYLEAGTGHPNPHLWMNVAYAELYVGRIRDALTKADPANAAAYAAGATAELARLGDLDAWVRAQIETVPAANRRIVSFHDAFPYFAAAYGLQVVGVVVPAPGQDPSAGDVARLVDAIRGAGVKAVLAEAQFSDQLARTIANETGVAVVSNLYDDTLGDAPVDSYDGVIRWDTEQLVAALR